MEAVLDSMGLEHPANLHCVKEHSSTFSGFSLPMLIISVKYVRFTEPSISERAFFFIAFLKGDIFLACGFALLVYCRLFNVYFLGVWKSCLSSFHLVSL